MPGSNVRVLVVDDQEGLAHTIASGLELLGGFDVVGVAETVRRAGELAAHRPDVALVDVRLAGGGGEAATREIQATSPNTRVLGQSTASQLPEVIQMLRAGASGYLAKGAPVSDLGAALRATARGETTLDSSIAGGLMDELMQHVDRETRLEEQRAIRRARVEAVLETDVMEIVFQPILHLNGGAVVGHEALARFPGEPRRSPDRWFAEAHEVGLGLELELAAVGKACARADELPAGTFLAVNVSPAAAESPRLLELVEAAPVEEIVLEVTEHARVEDYGRFHRAIEGVRERGARLAVDDAGAGFSSMRHILELKAELIKLDASLIHEVQSDRGRRSLAAALIAFGREMGVSILAEGIEQPAQLDELRRLGVDYGQGFYLGRPRPTPLAHS